MRTRTKVLLTGWLGVGAIGTGATWLRQAPYEKTIDAYSNNVHHQRALSFNAAKSSLESSFVYVNSSDLLAKMKQVSKSLDSSAKSEESSVSKLKQTADIAQEEVDKDRLFKFSFPWSKLIMLLSDLSFLELTHYTNFTRRFWLDEKY